MRNAVLAALIGVLPAMAPAQGVAHAAKIIGVVADSISGAPLQHAEIIASGVATPAITDSLGRFTIENLPPGTYQVGAFHPLLESLDIALATKPFVLGPDSSAVISLAVPSVKTLVQRYCPTGQSSSTPSVIAGRIQDPDTDEPIPGVTVSLAWTEIFVSKTTGVVRTPHELHTESNASGFFKICGLPGDLEGTLLATRADVTTPEIPVSMNGALLDFRSLALPARGEGEARHNGIVTGHVLSPAGKPVANARVEIPMSNLATTTREDGAFRLLGVHTGTQMLIARSISYSTAAEPINVTSREPLDVSLMLGDKVVSLDTVLITARRNVYLDKNGFTARKKRGAGAFFTREDFDHRKPNAVTDMMKNVAGFTVVRVTGGAVVSSSRAATSFYSSRCTRAFIDGFEWRDLMPGDLDMIVNPDDVVGMEVYQPGDVPVRFRGIKDCTTIVIWTQFRPKASK